MPSFISRPGILPGLIAVVPLLLAAVGQSQAQHGIAGIEPAFPNLQFTKPVDLQHAGDTSNRLFVVEQAGLIQVFHNDPAASSKEAFLDIRNRVNSGGNEEGLLGLAFHPQYAQNGFFYVYYTARGSDQCSGTSGDRCSKVSRFSVSTSDPDAADAGSESVILQVGQPAGNHNGGQIRFGPDGFLYVALGDGGSSGDPRRNGQNRATLLGSILRIDVDNPTNGRAYGIPPDNPFAGSQFREEIFAYGLRNPWRFSFDPETGDLWAGDVGQNAAEEIDIIVNGGNYGWNIMEGDRCFSPPSGCDRSGLRLPVWTYGHGSSGGRSVIGGFVYHGARIGGLVGTYVYGDFVSGRIWGLTPSDDGTYSNLLINATGLSISSFGVDQAGELYMCTFEGIIYRFEKKDSTGSTGETPALPPSLDQSFPNPLTSAGTIGFTLDSAGTATLQIFDSTGRLVATPFTGHLASGRHSLTVSADGLASGAYFYRLRTASGAATRRMIVL